MVSKSKMSMVKSQVDKKLVRQMVHGAIKGSQEHKRCSFSVATADLVVAGVLNGVTYNIVQGDEINCRSGDTILLEHMRFYWSFRQIAATYVPVSVRLIIFADMLNYGTTPAVTDVLDTASYLSGYSMINLQKNRFKIYHDSLFDLVGQTSKAIHSFETQYKVNKRVFYSAATAVGGANGKHAIFTLVLSSVASANNYVFASGCTLTYTDS
jgi:hypothetical protein